MRKGEPIVEIETDKVTIEIEAPAPGILRDVTAGEGDVVPVGQAIALIVAEGSAVVGRARPGSGGTPAGPDAGGATPGRRRSPGRSPSSTASISRG